jgi:hypothetical protein
VLRYPSGTKVTLTAREGLGTLETFLHPGDEGFPASQIPPGEMPKFLGWVGDCEDGTEANVCVLTLSQGNRYEVLALYEFYECPEDSTSAVAYPESQFDTACGDRPAEGPITPDDESIGNRRRQRVCDAPPPAPDDFQVPEHLVATVEMLSAISPELGEAAIDYAATYDPLVTPWVEWFLDPAHELQVRSKPGFRCDGSER